MNISIIGAGPAGSYLAKLLAQQGHDTTIYEDHKCIGKPVQCTGLVTKTFLELSPIKKEFLTNEMKTAKIISPNSQATEIPLTEYALNRTKLDQYLANQAINAGAQIKIQHRFIGLRNNEIIMKHNGEITRKKTDIIVGADGPLSEVAKHAGIYGQRKMFIGHQATIKGKFNKQTFTTYFGQKAPNFFAWIVPENNTTARAGLATETNTQQHFQKYIKEIKGKITAIQAGLIPNYQGNEIVEKNNVYLVGDAAALVKATTGGGIYTGMLSSKILAESIETGINYTTALKPLKKMLWIHKIIRKMLNNFTNENYNELIQMMNNEKIKETLTKYTREQPAQIIPRILYNEPKFLKFAMKILC